MNKYKTPEEFYNDTLGQSYEMDGAPAGDPYQCADYFKYACWAMLGYHWPTGGDGYVDNWWYHRNDHADEFIFIEDPNAFENGDFVLWGNAKRKPDSVFPLSHVAMYYNGRMVGQNQGTKSVTSNHVGPEVWANALGAFRFRAWAEGSHQETTETLKGIDISNWQKGLDLSKIDFDFAIFKSTEGIGFVDHCCDQWVDYCRKNGKKWGFYHYAKIGNDPVREARFWVSQTEGYWGEGLPALDIEEPDPNVVEWCRAFLAEVIRLTGIKPLVYMSEQSFEWRYDWTPVVALDCGLWVAAYRNNDPDYNYDMSGAGNPPKVKHWPFYAMWQWTSKGRLNGYDGNLDCNIFYGSADIWQKYVISYNGDNPEEPQETPEEKIARLETENEELKQKIEWYLAVIGATSRAIETASKAVKGEFE